MREGDGKMLFVRDRLVVRRGEHIRFVIENAGEFAHDFVVANTADNLKHAALMQKYPDMEHDDPNGKTLQPCRASVRHGDDVPRVRPSQNTD